MNKIRCEHCGQRQSNDNDACGFCGAPLPNVEETALQRYSRQGYFTNFCSTAYCPDTPSSFPNEVFIDYGEGDEAAEFEVEDDEEPEEVGIWQRLINKLAKGDRR